MYEFVLLHGVKHNDATCPEGTTGDGVVQDIERGFGAVPLVVSFILNGMGSAVCARMILYVSVGDRDSVTLAILVRTVAMVILLMLKVGPEQNHLG